MTTSFVLVQGAGGMAWYWHRVAPLLRRAGHESIAVDLPRDDESMGLRDYAEIVIRAIGERTNVVPVAQSLGGFTAPLVCARTSIGMLIFVNAMIPQRNETAGECWGHTGAVKARLAAARVGGYGSEFDLKTYLPARCTRGGVARRPIRSAATSGIDIHAALSLRAIGAGARRMPTIRVADVAETCAELARHGVALLNGPIDRPWGRRTAAFRDPAGNVWEIAQVLTQT